MVNEDLARIEKRLRRVFALASNGFYQSIGNDKRYSTMFLYTLIEIYKALNELRDYRRTLNNDRSS